MKKNLIIKNAIRTIPGFPAPGILFRDVTTLMKDKKAFRTAIECLVLESRKFRKFDYVAGIEARGFIFGSMLADRTGTGFVPIRKPGKLPSEVLSMEYELEYGKDKVEVHVDAIQKGSGYLVVDDLLATGGTSEAACRLIEKGEGMVVGCLFLIELPELRGRNKLASREVISIVEFEGEEQIYLSEISR
jgi:adenine phosphoribosyltransferase